MPILSILNKVLEVFARTIKQLRAIKEIHTGKEEVKVSLFTDDMILYIKVPKDSTRKHLQLINTFSQVAELTHKIKTQKLVAFLYNK